MAENKSFSISREQLTGPTGSTILITGASSGIGLQTAIILHELGNNIIAVDRSEPHSSAPAALTESPRFLLHKCDITSWVQQRAAFEAGVKKFGSLDCCFVNAGVSEVGDQFFDEQLDQDGLLKEPNRATVDIDMHAANDTVRLAIHYMRKKTGEKKGGSIVLTASLAGYLASAGAPLYSAAKHGIVGLMRALKNDLATLDIAVSVVAPGITLTPIINDLKEGQSLQDWAKSTNEAGVPINSPQEIAQVAVWLMSLGKEGNGKGILVQAGRLADLEAGIAKSRKIWMSEEQLSLFRGGRTAPLFPNKL